MGKLLVLILVWAVMSCIAPLAFIWAINGFFSMHIPFDLFHWFCAFVLFVLARGEFKITYKE